MINEILERFSVARVFTKIDVKNAYYRLRIREGDEWKTEFRTRYGLFEYLVMRFGLTNAPASFQSYTNRVLRPYLDITAIVYLDDVFVFSRNPSQHEKHVREVLKTLLKAGLYAKLSKCLFSVTRIHFLGFILTEKKALKWKKIASPQSSTGQSQNPSMEPKVFLDLPTSTADLSKGFPE